MTSVNTTAAARLKLHPTAQEIATDPVLSGQYEALAQVADRLRTHRLGGEWQGVPAGTARQVMDAVHRLREGWTQAETEAARLSGLLRDLQEAGTDPDLLRWCGWPGCWRSYHAATGPTGDPGWIRANRDMTLCPTHKAAGHTPRIRIVHDPISLIVDCECGETVDLGGHTNLADAHTWWEDHVRDRKVLPARRVWMFGDPEPEVGTRVLVAGIVWVRHQQHRWILWTALRSGCPGIEWHKLNDQPEFPVVEVLPDEQVDVHSRLVIPSAEAAEAAAKAAAKTAEGGTR